MRRSSDLGKGRLIEITKTFAVLIGAVPAFVMANLWPETYHDITHSEWGTVFGLHITLHWVVTAVLMAGFFLLAAAEVREACLPEGALHGRKRATLPVVATLGGVAGPALLFLVLSSAFQPEATHGFVIPTATDIVFALLFMSIVYGSAKHPAVTMILAIAVLDDMIGMILITVVYGHFDWMTLSFFLLAVTVGIGVPFILRKCDVRSFGWYVLAAGVPSWLLFAFAHFEPAIAMVFIVAGMPHGKRDDGLYAEMVEEVEHELHPDHQPSHEVIDKNDTLRQMAHFLKKQSWWILLAFGFVSAGVEISNFGVLTWLVLFSLLFGKLSGIILATIVGIKLFKCQLPEQIKMRDIVVISIAAGTGFTVSLFVTYVAYTGAMAGAAALGAALSLPVCFVATCGAAWWLKVGRFARIKIQ